MAVSEDQGTTTEAAPYRVDIDGVGKRPKNQVPLDNPLNDYDSYTYCLSLHMLTPQDFNRIVMDPSKSYTPTNVLISSAGRYNVNFQRNPAFTEDFYFDNFKMSSYINIGQRNRNSNLLESHFTIIEPNGFTFINRLLDAAETIGHGQGRGNYLKLPYILQIDFFGYIDGEISGAPIPNMTKIIPINLIDMKSRVTQRGTEYSIHAVPYNHIAFSGDLAVGKADFLIKAKTVSDVFGSGAISTSVAFLVQDELQNLQRQESDLEKQLAAATSDNVRENLLQQTNTIKSKIANRSNAQFQVTGFADALNSWWNELRKRGETFTVNKIYVKFDPRIGNADLLPTTKSPATVQQAAAGGNNTQDQKAALQAAGGQSKGKIDFNAVSMTVPAGTSMLKLIDWSVRNSKYIGSQLKDPTAAVSIDPTANNANQLSAPLEWYRIIPEVKIDGDYDPSTNLYPMSITYYVTPWTVNSKHPMGPMGKVDGYSKVYDYLYTGANKDIIDMQLDFNLLYVVQMTSNRNKEKTTQTAPALDGANLRGELDNNPNTASDVQRTGPVVVPQSKLQPVPIVHNSNNIRYGTRTGGEQAAAVTAGDLSEALMVDSKGDMISLRLKILGDPHFIKQDDIFFNSATAQTGTQLTPNNSLWTDNGELYTFVNFRTPIDYDESTGLAVPSSGQTYSYSQWTGIYKILKVESEFNKGKFEQVLEMARLPLSDADFTRGSNAQQRAESLNLISIGNSGGFAASRFTGPLIIQQGAGVSGLPAYNSPAAALQSGSSAIQAIFQNAITKAVSDTVGAVTKKVTDSVGATVKSAVTPFTDSLSASYYEWRGDSMIMDQLPIAEEIPPLTDAEIGDLFGDLSDIEIPDFEPPTDLDEFLG